MPSWNGNVLLLAPEIEAEETTKHKNKVTKLFILSQFKTIIWNRGELFENKDTKLFVLKLFETILLHCSTWNLKHIGAN